MFHRRGEKGREREGEAGRERERGRGKEREMEREGYTYIHITRRKLGRKMPGGYRR